MSLPVKQTECGDAVINSRPLIIQVEKIRFSFPVSTKPNEWIAAELLREEFLHFQKSQDAVETPEELEDSKEATIQLFASFLGFVADNLRPKEECATSRTAVLLSALRVFTIEYLSKKDIHSLTATYDIEVRRIVLSSYMRTVAVLENQKVAEIPRGPSPALLKAAGKGEASIFALFGGQGTNEVYFDELQNLHDIYTPYVGPFLKAISDEILQPLASGSDITFYEYGLDAYAWLSGSTPRPATSYLASIPISFPLIGLTQLTQYLVACRVSGITPGDMRRLLGGTTGHSQGVVSAVCIAASDSFKSFTENAKKALKWLFYSGLRGQEAFPILALEPSIVKDAVEGGEGVPSPMLSVTGLLLKDLEPHINKTNKHLPSNSQLFVSLHNGPKTFVVTGPAKALFGLVTSLRKVKAPAGLDQSKVPFSQRKAVFSVRFLVVGVPYHSKYLEGAAEKVVEDLGEELWKGSDLAIPVYNTEDGSDLCSLTTSVTRSLCDQIFTKPIHWSAATKFTETATHAVDFGPGGLSGIGPLTARNFEGRGIRVIVIGEKGKNGSEFYDAVEVKKEQCWVKKFSPALTKTSDGKIQIDTPFSRLLGKPPVMVAGMTPTTVKAGFVSAVLRAGYHVELAGGGHYNPKALRAKVAEIQAQIPDGVGLTLNSLYINPRQFSFQFPLWQEMRKEGIPVEGFCVAAGIPTTEKAAEIIEGLKSAGIKHVSFKPGSVDGIRQVVNIAAANPDYPIIMQWTGGRAGGHHSCEDFHQPILSTYASIRQHSNLILVGGSGFGGADDVWPYLTGDWSAEVYGVQPMPFDGFLFASRVMVAKEAHTSSSVKDLIVAAAGVDDKAWEGTYAKETGGILTVRSELGEPIHKVATRGVKLWKEFDNTVFNLPKEKRVEWLTQNRASVIAKLNRDFSKPWFAWKQDGSVPEDIADMTYEETVLRMVRLMYVAHEKRWVDISLRNLTGDWLRRIEERFAGLNGSSGRKEKPSFLQSFTSLDDPTPFVESFFKEYKEAKKQLLATEDRSYFLAIAQRPGQKPVPFIPVLDASFEVWFKKDSLWAAEDIEAVFDQDPQRVCILQGPVAVKHSRVKDEPIADLLGNVVSGLSSKLLTRYYGGDASKVPSTAYLSSKPSSAITLPLQVKVSSTSTSTSYQLSHPLPDTNTWLDALAGPQLSWLRALLCSPNIVQGSSYIDNPIRRLFTPRAGQHVVVESASGVPQRLSAYGSARSYGQHQADFKAVEVSFTPSSSRITVILYEERRGSSIPLTFYFNYRPEMGYAPVHEVMEGRNTRIKQFYWKLWFGDNESLSETEIRDTFVGPEVTVDAEHVEKFCSIVGNQGEAFKTARNEKVDAPMDFALILGWQAIMKAIFPASIDGDLLRLVHLTNSFRMIEGERPMRAGDVCHAEAKVVSVINNDSGKVVQVKGHVIREGSQVIEVVSSFLYRGRFTDFVNTFEIIDEPDYVVDINTDTAVGVLLSKEWFQWEDDSKPLKPKTRLIFRLQSEVSYKDKTHYSVVVVAGDVFVKDPIRKLVKVATVEFESDNSQGNPVVSYLKRHGAAQAITASLPENGYSMTTADSSLFVSPLTNEPYSKVSGDFNPIHVNPYFSDFASLPGTITHGLWSSAATRRFVENVVACGRAERVLSYNASFVGMILPGDELKVDIRHAAMKDGNIVVSISTTNQRGEKVLEGSAEVAQPDTVYVFTGQGSQEPGMGMDLYQSSPAARAVWEAADAHLLAVYGFSIVDIVKNNPKAKTIYFGGLKGQAIRQRYMDMTYDTLDKDGQVRTLPLFADINIRTPAYTFSHPAGLLYATQFAQIALVVTEKAAFDDMRSKGLIQRSSAFAGHSLGEYSALASIADVLPISSLVDVVFYRGITMQRAVERDENNRSNYAMCAVNPSRVSKTFNDAALREVVDTISQHTSLLLEIVNYNVEGQQYVCAGELVALQTLTNVLNYLKVEKVDVAKLAEKFTVEKVKDMLLDIVKSCYDRALELKKAEGYIKLERGFATIPLAGIDVPFHSRYLWAGVMPFRAYLSKKIDAALINPDTLIGKYVPNLIAKPFDVSREYAQKIYDQTSSPKLDKVLKAWDRENWGDDSHRQKLAYIILVELLAYQFASPVRWIETQDIFFKHFNFERFIEIGPSPTLIGMATRTLKAKYEVQDDSVSRTRAIYCHSKHNKEIYYQFEDEAPQEVPEAESAPTSAAPETVTVPASSAASMAPVSAPSGPAVAVPDEPLKAVDTLRTIIAQKLKKSVDDVPLSKSIKDLVGGKSTLQNEILGDLQLEFGSTPEKGEESSLEELGSALSTGYSGAPGKYTSGLVSRLVSGKMPGGFNISSIKSHLSKAWGLGPMRADGVLLVGVTAEPPKRLGSEVEAKAWLDSLVPIYAQRAGVSISQGGASGGGGGGGGGAVINSEEFLKFQADQQIFAEQQIELYMRYLNRDSRAGQTAFAKEKTTTATMQRRLDAITKEHGDVYLDGIQPVFEPLKARHFDSSWNWVRQDALLMFYDIIFGRLTTVDREITARCIAIMNRADPALLHYMKYHINQCDPSRGPTYKLAKEFGQRLMDNCSEAIGQAPLYKDVTFPTAPHTEISPRGEIIYTEINREGVRKLEAYVEEMASGDNVPGSVNIQKVQDDVVKLWNAVKSQPEISQDQKNKIKALYDGVVRSLRKTPEVRHRAVARHRRSSSQFLRPQVASIASVSADKVPLLHLKRKVGTSWEYSSNLTGVYLDVLGEIATSGTTFKDKNALLTGVGRGSIGVEILKGLLSGGAHVVITTSRYSRKTVEYYQGIYQQFGSRGSALTVVPFNQGSKQDVEALVDYIYSTLGMDLDYILPFAAVPENGREIDGLDDKSELAHRIMLVNLLRLLGAVKMKKASRNFVTRPTQVILPLSPNHGLFGNDGLYSESKISLETLFNRWNSESWGEYLCLAGAVIGWTRGTGLMDATDSVAHQIEAYGVRTFSAKEMAFNILGLMHPLLFSITQVEPIWADLNGGMDRLPDLAEITTKIRTSLQQQAELRRAITRDNAVEFQVMNGNEAERVLQTVNITPRANLKFEFPRLDESVPDLKSLRGLLDLEKVIVVTGFAELGPWGSSRTRWEMEAYGEFTIEGCIEMAWMMGFIKHFDGKLADGSLYVGWVDTQTNERVDDKDVRGRYEKEILAHAGIRMIEPENFRGYDPKKKQFNQEIELTHDLEPLEASEEEAAKFKHEHGEKCDTWEGKEGQWFMKLKKGARIFVTKSLQFSRLVAGQIPKGWHAGRFGIPEDIIAQVDRVTLWSLVCAAEALNMSGITDPYELYQHMHPSEIGTCIGSGMGGGMSVRSMFRERRDGLDVQNDILQETFINTTAGWINLLLLSSSGPIKIPVGACATALQSVEIACDTILSGKATIMLAGGYDDTTEEGSYEFAQMKATSNAETELAMGREPTEMSRPTTTTRSGFMESMGSGVHVMMSAKTALELGCPIRGIVGFTSTSTDKAGRSVPAPGRGALTIAREIPSPHPLPILKPAYRARQLAFRRKQISQWLSNEHDLLKEDVSLRKESGEDVSESYVSTRVAQIESEAAHQEKDALAVYGMLEGASSDPHISPLRRALAVWGLNSDDIGVLSIHGTSTQANEANETHIWNDVFETLNRTPGNAVPIMAQKSLCGHAKGGSAAWQLAGLLQSVYSGVVPGNRNADNVDPAFRAYEHLVFPSKSIRTDGIMAGVMSSFGFGQVGGTVMVIHPRVLLGALEPSTYTAYRARNAQRYLGTYKAMSAMMTSNNLVKIKDAPPYTGEQEFPVLLNSMARATRDAKTGSYTFPAKLPKEVKVETPNLQAVVEGMKVRGKTAGVGVDHELISSVPSTNPTFVSRNFTPTEIAYCTAQPSPASSFAARWAGKEAVFKSLGVASKGAGAAMKDIEILPDANGAPAVTLHGEALAAAKAKGVKTVHVSLSHSDTVAVAFAQAEL